MSGKSTASSAYSPTSEYVLVKNTYFADGKDSKADPTAASVSERIFAKQHMVGSADESAVGDPPKKGVDEGKALEPYGPTNAKVLSVPYGLSIKALTSSSRARVRVPGKAVKVKLVGSYALVSSAATALSQVQALSPIAVSDYASFAAVYDLWRVKHIRIRFRLGSSGAIAGSADGAVAWDPSNLGAYASVSDVLTAQHHFGPICLLGSQATYAGTASVNGTGFHEFGFPLVDQRITNDSSAASAVGGGWVGTSDTTAIVGWVKPYINSLGGSLTSTLTMYVIYDVEFKSRT